MKIRIGSHHERGMAVVVMLALITLLLIYVAANLRSLNQLDGELKWIDQQQIRRLNAAGTRTVALATAPATGTNAAPADARRTPASGE